MVFLTQTKQKCFFFHKAVKFRNYSCYVLFSIRGGQSGSYKYPAVRLTTVSADSYNFATP